MNPYGHFANPMLPNRSNMFNVVGLPSFPQQVNTWPLQPLFVTPNSFLNLYPTAVPMGYPQVYMMKQVLLANLQPQLPMGNLNMMQLVQHPAIPVNIPAGVFPVDVRQEEVERQEQKLDTGNSQEVREEVEQEIVDVDENGVPQPEVQEINLTPTDKESRVKEESEDVQPVLPQSVKQESSAVPTPQTSRKSVKRKQIAKDPNVPELVLVSRTDGEKILVHNLAKRISYEIQMRKVSQRLFSQQVLGKPANYLSRMLNYPGDWEIQTTWKDKWRQMLSWLNLCEADKSAVLTGTPLVCCAFQALSESKYISKRTSYTKEQKGQLLECFKKNANPTREERLEIAGRMGLQSKQVKIYFKNLRKKTRNP